MTEGRNPALGLETEEMGSGDCHAMSGRVGSRVCKELWSVRGLTVMLLTCWRVRSWGYLSSEFLLGSTLLWHHNLTGESPFWVIHPNHLCNSLPFPVRFPNLRVCPFFQWALFSWDPQGKQNVGKCVWWLSKRQSLLVLEGSQSCYMYFIESYSMSVSPRLRPWAHRTCFA